MFQFPGAKKPSPVFDAQKRVRKEVKSMDQENPGLEIAKAFAEGAGKESTNKLAEFIGGFCPFYGLKKKAVDTYVHEIQQSNISPEAKMIAIANAKKTLRELKNQSAIINVAYDALDSGQNINVDALSSADDELISRLIDSGKFVSDEQLQFLWGNVLAGEFEQPGSTPKNMVRILSELSKDGATTFSNLCSLGVDILADNGSTLEHIGCHLIFPEVSDDYLQQLNINTETILEFNHLGLVGFTSTYYTLPLKRAHFPFIHLISEDHVMTVVNSLDDFPTGRVLLTKAGRHLLRFIPRLYNRHHMEKIKAYLQTKDFDVLKKPGVRITKTTEGGKGTGYSYERLPIVPLQTQEQK